MEPRDFLGQRELLATAATCRRAAELTMRQASDFQPRQRRILDRIRRLAAKPALVNELVASLDGEREQLVLDNAELQQEVRALEIKIQRLRGYVAAAERRREQLSSQLMIAEGALAGLRLAQQNNSLLIDAIAQATGAAVAAVRRRGSGS